MRGSISLALLVGGCSPTITAFDATPRHVCPNDEVELSWDFGGTGTLTSSAPLVGLPKGEVSPSSGSVKLRPTEATHITLHVTRPLRKPANAEIDIDMEAGSEVSASIGDPSATCDNGVVTSTAHMNNFGGLNIVVVGIAPGNTRAAFDIKRVDPTSPSAAPKLAHITTSQPSAAFAGMPINGDWVISSPLLQGETCDKAKPVLPSNLIVRAYANCHGGSR
jgi:hypothetical protein